MPLTARAEIRGERSWELLGQTAVDPGLNEILLVLRRACGVARILLRVARAAGAFGHLTALDAHDRARADGQAGAIRIVCGLQRVLIVGPDVVTAEAEGGVARIALLEVDRLRVFGVGHEAESAAGALDTARAGRQEEAGFQHPEVDEVRL